MRRSEHVRLALSLGFEVVAGKRHLKIYKGTQLVAVAPRGRDGKNGKQWDNFRAALLRAAREEG